MVLFEPEVVLDIDFPTLNSYCPAWMNLKNSKPN